MADERFELLSRYLDDDLPAAERADLESCLSEDTALAADLESARALREAVAGVAAGMAPPPELDRVMEPMLRSAPPPRHRARPVFRWLGAAAAVVLGVTVAVEMSRRNPEPTLSPRASATIDDEAIFELAPLPTAVPAENRPLGATDQLLREELGQPPAPEPSALEVIGPLESASDVVEPPSAAAADPAPREQDHGTRPETLGRADTQAAAVAPHSMAEGKGAVPSPGSVDSSKRSGKTADAARRSASRDRGVQAEARAATTAAVVAGAAGELWRGPSDGCPAGTWAVVLVVVDERVIDIIDSTTPGDTRRDKTCRPIALLGAAFSGAPDGELEVTIVVE